MTASASWRRRARGVALSAAAALLVVLGVLVGRPIARGIVVVGILSTLLAYLVAPIAERLRRNVRVGRPSRPLPLDASVLLIYLVVAGAGFGAWQGVRPRVERQLAALGESLPARLDLLRARARGLEARVNQLPRTEAVRARVVAVTRAVSASIEEHASDVMADVEASRPLVPWLSLVPVVAFLLVTRWNAFRRTTVSALPPGHLRWRGDEFFGHVNFVLAGYTRAQVWSCVVVAVAASIGFAAIRVPYALALGWLAGLLEFFPVIGPLAAAVVAAAVVDGERLLVLAAFLVGLRLIQDYVVYPRLIGRGMHLPALAIIGAIWLGAIVGGAAGVLVAVPAVGIAAVGLRHYRDYRAIETLVREHEQRQRAAVAAETPGPGEPGTEATAATGPDASGAPPPVRENASS